MRVGGGDHDLSSSSYDSWEPDIVVHNGLLQGRSEKEWTQRKPLRSTFNGESYSRREFEKSHSSRGRFDFKPNSLLSLPPLLLLPHHLPFPLLPLLSSLATSSPPLPQSSTIPSKNFFNVTEGQIVVEIFDNIVTLDVQGERRRVLFVISRRKGRRDEGI